MTKTITDMKQKQAEALRLIKEQGLRVLVCCGTGCISSGAESVYQKFKELGVNVLPLSTYDKMTVVPTGCHGFCEQGVLVVIPDLHTTYVKVKPDDVREIVENHLIKGIPVERLLYVEPATGQKVKKTEDINFG